MINELIDQIGGRERLELATRCKGYEASVFYPRAGQIELMARALLAVLDAKPVAWQWRLISLDDKSQIGPWRLCLAPLTPGKGVGYKTEAIPLYTVPPAASVPDGLAAAVNLLLDSDGSRGTFSAIRRGNALTEVERLLAAAPAPENK